MMKSKPIAAPFKGGEGDLFRRAASQPGAGGAKKRWRGVRGTALGPTTIKL
jgi:hypothetical protein